MRKYAIVYKKISTGEEFWSCSVDDKGCTYCLRPKKSDVPTSHAEATEFYGKRGKIQAQRRIDADIKHRKWFYDYAAEIIEYDREPEWRFEILYALGKAFGDEYGSEIKKGFPLNPNIEYRHWIGHTRPLLCDLNEEELERYYAWRKEHYKGKKKDI